MFVLHILTNKTFSRRFLQWFCDGCLFLFWFHKVWAASFLKRAFDLLETKQSLSFFFFCSSLRYTRSLSFFNRNKMRSDFLIILTLNHLLKICFVPSASAPKSCLGRLESFSTMKWTTSARRTWTMGSESLLRRTTSFNQVWMFTGSGSGVVYFCYFRLV